MFNRTSKKIIFLSVILLVLFSALNARLPKPKKNAEVGGLVGKILTNIKLQENVRWGTFLPGTYLNEFWLEIYNDKTGKLHYIYNSIDGFYHIVNLPPGDYTIKSWEFKYQAGNWKYWMGPLGFDEENSSIKIKVSPNRITAIDTVIVDKLIDSKETPTDVKLDKPNLEELKKYIRDQDPKGFWKDYDLK